MGLGVKVRAFGTAAAEAGLVAILLAALLLGRPAFAEAADRSKELGATAAAAETLGFAYENARGVGRDYAKAAQLYELAAKQGDAMAQYQLGVLYQEGLGVRKDDIEADKWFSRSAAQGSVEGKDGLQFLRTAIAPRTLPLTAEQDDADVPSYDLKLLPDGRSLIISGGIRFGLAQDLKTVLDDNPGIRTITLDSPGGRIKEANAVRELIRKRGLDTYASRDCLSACTLIFVAGKHRGVSFLARLGFHSDAITVPMPGKSLLLWFVNQATVGLYADAGVDQRFMLRVIATPSQSMWFPTTAELLDAHVLIADADEQGSVGALAVPGAEGTSGRSLQAVH